MTDSLALSLGQRLECLTQHLNKEEQAWSEAGRAPLGSQIFLVRMRRELQEVKNLIQEIPSDP